MSERKCYFCGMPLKQGNPYAQIAIGVEGKGEVGLNLCSCLACVVEKAPTIVDWAKMAIRAKDLLSMFVRPVEPPPPKA